jgi:F-type H+-transporting ATPase subunit epsilon
MLPEAIELQVVTPERHVLSENVQALEMPGKDGYLGILPGHAPLITLLGVGTLTYHQGGQTGYLSVINGFAEVLPDRVIVLAEISERAEEIDVARSRAALQTAQAEAAKPGMPEAESREAEAKIERANARLQTASKAGSAGSSQDSRRSGR